MVCIYFQVFGFPLAFLLHVILMSCAATLTIIAVGIALGNFRGRAILGHGVLTSCASCVPCTREAACTLLHCNRSCLETNK